MSVAKLGGCTQRTGLRRGLWKLNPLKRSLKGIFRSSRFSALSWPDMAEALGVASGIAGLLSLADIVIVRLIEYVRSVRDAREEISSLLAETSNLYGILHGLNSMVQQYENEKTPRIQIDSIYNCQVTLENLLSCLEKGDPSRSKKPLQSFKKKLFWPFSRLEAEKFLTELQRQKSTLSLALSADSLLTLLRALSVHKELRDDIRSLKSDFIENRDTVRKHLATQTHQKILDFFEKIDPTNKQATNLKLLQPGTGLWFLECQEFKKWQETDHGRLWVYGILGAGKSVLAALIINTLASTMQKEDALAYFYCDYKDAATHSLSNILGSVAKQIALQDLSLRAFAKLEDSYNKNYQHIDPNHSTNEENLRDLIMEMTQSFNSVVIVIGGLDECATDRAYVVEFLASLGVQTSSTIKTLFSSRDEYDIRQELKDYIPISIAARSSDIRLYVAAELQKRTDKGKPLVRRATLREEIMTRLVEKADGM